MKKTLLSLLFVAFVINALRSQTATSLNFDGVDDNVRGAVVSTSITNITLEARVAWAGGAAPFNRVIVNNGNTSTSGYGIFIPSGSSVINILYGGVVSIPTTYTIFPGQFVLLTVVIKSNSVALYVNGSPNFTTTTSVPAAPSGSFSIGSNNSGTENFNGSIDEVRFWNRALCPGEISHRAFCQASGNEANLIANYNFNQGIAAGNNPTVTILNDLTPSNFTCTLANFALTTGSVSNWVSPPGALSTICTAAPNTLSITPTGSIAICAGSSVALSVTGANSYTWSNASNNSSIAVTPSASIIYSVLGTNSITGCYGMSTKSVTVNPLPNVIATTNNTLLCAGQTATLTGSGAGTYTWNPGGASATIAVSPTVNTSYTIVGTDINTCTNTAVITQSVSLCTSIQQTTGQSSEDKIFPNPSSGEFSINLNSFSEKTSVEIYNALGQLILNEKVNNSLVKFNLTQMPKGIYVLRLKENNAVIKTEKLVKD